MTNQTASNVPLIELNDGHRIPQLGLGVWQVEDGVAQGAVAEALRLGYRHIDTARIYENEGGTGAGIAESGIAREDLFVTTKLWNSDQGGQSTRPALESSLERLGLDYVDLYLIHWPTPERGLVDATFSEFVKLKDAGLVKSIGVSNFRIEDIESVIAATGVTPAINQIELHPGFAQSELRAYHASKGIATEAWSPLGQGTLLDNAVLEGIAAAHGVTTAQVVLRWHLQLGNVVIPKSVTPSRIAANIDVFGFELTGEDIAAIAAIDSAAGRIGPNPAEFNLA